MNYFLAKIDPETYSIDDLAKEKETIWDGVTNPTARIVIKSMKIGDKVFVYHSGKEKSIVGLMEIIGLPYDDPKNPKKSSVIKAKFLKKFSETQQVSLSEIKESKKFDNWELVRISRLSTMKCPIEFVKYFEKRSNLTI